MAPRSTLQQIMTKPWGCMGRDTAELPREMLHCLHQVVLVCQETQLYPRPSKKGKAPLQIHFQDKLLPIHLKSSIKATNSQASGTGGWSHKRNAHKLVPWAPSSTALADTAYSHHESLRMKPYASYGFGSQVRYSYHPERPTCPFTTCSSTSYSI